VVPPRKSPRAYVSIVSPQRSTVHKRQRGVRAQDGGGFGDAAGQQDESEGPAVERLE
jgi:hypothetical protein